MSGEFRPDPQFMRRAIELAKKGTGRTNPNPLVGAVIVKDGAIIGEGYHHVYGDLHAERDALKDCAEKHNDPKGATIYVTLEPCCHFGKQPPCTHAVAESGITRVVIGSRDPNPLVSGKGTEYLRSKGIEVIEDFLRDECDSINEIFFHYITTKTPFVALKYAMTMDGKIATKTGDSKWISGEKSRQVVQTLRNKYTCIMAGIGTVLADDPLLTCRIEGGRNPVRVICDSNLRIPLESQIVKTARDVRTIVACAGDGEDECAGNTSTGDQTSNVAAGIDCNTSNVSFTDNEATNSNCNTINASFTDNEALDRKAKVQALQNAGIEVFTTRGDRVQLPEVMAYLAAQKLDSVLIEGGGELNFSALESGIVNKVFAFIAPKAFGGGGRSPVCGSGVERVMDSFKFKVKNVSLIDGDVLVEFDANDGKENSECNTSNKAVNQNSSDTNNALLTDNGEA